MMTSLQIVLAPVAGAAGLLLCPPSPDRPFEDDGTYVVQMEETWAVVSTTPDLPGASRLAPAESASPAVDGLWLAPMPWEVIAIHAAVLPTGEVLHYSYPGGGEGSRARLWNPATGVFTPVDWVDDLFCSGLSFLPDGTLYVTGGNDAEGCDFRGIHDTNIFNPFTRAWIGLELMEDGRWYPSNLTLPDGRVLIFSGNDRTCDYNGEVELFTPGKGLELVVGGYRELRLYPRIHLLTSGKLAHVGPENAAWTFEMGAGWEFVAFSPNWRSQGTSVLVPGRTDQVMVIGGSGGVVHGTCEIIDFSEPEPSFRFTGALNHPRAHADALVLPDKTVLLMGGGVSDLYGDPVNIPEIYDPDTETWREVATHVFGRMYHATSLLLPDGRVLVAGQDNGDSAFTGEIYMPPYLFRGARPTITAAPPRVFYDRSFTIETPEAEAIASAVLIRLSTVTHSINLEQRLIDLAFVNQGGGTLRATAPPGPTHAPPGYYMLFILNGDEVPSTASMVQVLPWTAGDANNDGAVDFADILAVLTAWGPCPPPPVECAGDMNGDGFVNFEDVLEVLANWG